jgi:hypothetical protein
MAIPFIPRRSQEPSPPPQQPNRTEVYNITPQGTANATLLEKLAVENIPLLRESYIKMLSGYAIGERKVESNSSGSTLKRFQSKKDDWVPIRPLSTQRKLNKNGKEIAGSSELDIYNAGEYPVIGAMPLKHAIPVVEQIINSFDPTSGTTWLDPQATNTVDIAYLVGIHAAFLLDNPNYEYTGNESDMAFFALNVCRNIHHLLNRSIGGFFPNILTESTTNIYKKDVSSTDASQYMTRKKQNGTERFLNNLH